MTLKEYKKKMEHVPPPDRVSGSIIVISVIVIAGIVGSFFGSGWKVVAYIMIGGPAALWLRFTTPVLCLHCGNKINAHDLGVCSQCGKNVDEPLSIDPIEARGWTIRNSKRGYIIIALLVIWGFAAFPLVWTSSAGLAIYLAVIFFGALYASYFFRGIYSPNCNNCHAPLPEGLAKKILSISIEDRRSATCPNCGSNLNTPAGAPDRPATNDIVHA